MAIASARYRFLLVDIGAEGRHSDSGVFTNSVMGRRFRNNEMNVPSPSPIVIDGEPMPYVIVADEAFQLSNFIIRPYPGRAISDEQKIFNYRLSRARRVIENAFGIMIARWRIFTKPIYTSLLTADKIVQACVVLHNFLMDKPNYCDRGFADELNGCEIIRGSWRNELQNNTALTPYGSAGSNTHSRIAALGREKFKDYFLNEGAVPWQWGL
ncbi:PREDICTED: uncharacterized protein LOC108782008 [Cyphomyrmex costatus]|uniref:uncharacterized protein LOC108782008 n=1 Tax=Cyphomyrmex costatus TaxID=456900 RepID=UPI0008524644|nr:PREDICTED: uncharacterized protein LOC108782008 [Cyphomyrmex costatus]